MTTVVKQWEKWRWQPQMLCSGQTEGTCLPPANTMKQSWHKKGFKGSCISAGNTVYSSDNQVQDKSLKIYINIQNGLYIMSLCIVQLLTTCFKQTLLHILLNCTLYISKSCKTEWKKQRILSLSPCKFVHNERLLYLQELKIHVQHVSMCH